MSDWMPRYWLGMLIVTACSDADTGPIGGSTSSSASSGGAGGAPLVDVTPPPAGTIYETLSQWNLFHSIAEQTPAQRVVPYEVNAALFSDYSSKLRFVYVPKGETIQYADTERWQLPVGSIIAKTFAYPADLRAPSQALRLLETRILHHEAEGWSVYTYVYDETGNDARRTVAGATIPANFTGLQGEPRSNDYGVPNTNECKECHSSFDAVGPIGIRTRQLNRNHNYGGASKNQIDHLAAIGFLSSAGPGPRQTLPDPLGAEALEDRVRAYFEANCAHCHSKGGPASQSSLLLDFEATAPGQPAANWGRCKIPTSAGGATCGKTYDVVPGQPDESILICRLASPDPSVRMPPLATKLIHSEGVELVRAWIAAQPPGCPKP